MVGAMPRTACVVGATGLVGRHLVDVLIHDPEYSRVIALVRRASGRTHDKLEERIVDFDALEREPLDVDDAFCALGTTIKKAGSKEAFRRVDFDYVLAFAKAARKGGKRFLLVSALGADSGSSMFYNRVKGEMEEAVRALGFERTLIFRPSFLSGDREEKRAGERVGIAVANVVGAIPIGLFRRIRPIEGKDVARGMVSAAKRDDVADKVYSSEAIQQLADGAR
jgi:uncharacterized protein YbjT (DUF2867 family)